MSNDELMEIIQVLKEMDSYTPHTTFKDLLLDNIKVADMGAEHSATAWNEYCILCKVWDYCYPNEKWFDYEDNKRL